MEQEFRMHAVTEYLKRLASSREVVFGKVQGREIDVLLFPDGAVEFRGDDEFLRRLSPNSSEGGYRFDADHKPYFNNSSKPGEYVWEELTQELIEEGIHTLLLMDPRIIATAFRERVISTYVNASAPGIERILVEHTVTDIAPLMGIDPKEARFADTMVAICSAELSLQKNTLTLRRNGLDGEDPVVQYSYMPL